MRFPGCISNFYLFERETVLWIMIKWLTCHYVVSVSSGICQVLFSQVTKYETESVILPCFTTIEEQVEWKIFSPLQNFILGYERRIYSTFGIQRGFNHTERYSVSKGSGFYNLTIINLNISETGEYICIQDLGGGPRSSTYLFVNGELYTFQLIDDYEFEHQWKWRRYLHWKWRIRSSDQQHVLVCNWKGLLQLTDNCKSNC